MIPLDKDFINEIWDLHTRTAKKLDMDLSELTAEDTFMFGAMHICTFLREGALRQKDIDFKMLNSMCNVFTSYLVEKGVLK